MNGYYLEDTGSGMARFTTFLSCKWCGKILESSYFWTDDRILCDVHLGARYHPYPRPVCVKCVVDRFIRIHCSG